MTQQLTLEQQACNNETRKHIARVQELILKLVGVLCQRGVLHDASKLVSPEVEGFTEHTVALAKTEYNSPEYKAGLDALKEALSHHYANNRHHPEHHKNGMRDMNLVDILEMFCDWKAGSERQLNGNIRTSIDINAERFDIPPLLVAIFHNSVDLLTE